jgi:glycosyltransferase involved in cell wall biosynthesis
VIPAVSIILPTFNRLQFLRPAIDSVFAQTFHDWELIIADDGSDAETKTYLESLRDSRVCVIWLSHTGRPSVVSNVAVRAARGEYIAFLDSDDLWLPKKLEAQISSMRRHPAREWSYTNFALIDEAGKPAPSPRGHGRPACAGWVLEKLLKGGALIAQPSVVVSRRLLQQSGPFDEELTMCYDDELWLRLAAHSEIDAIDEPLTLVRRHSQHSGSDGQAWRDRRRVFEKALRANQGSYLEPTLRKLRAEMSAGLAKSHARYGNRGDAIGTLLSSLPHSWRYPLSWLGAVLVTADSFAPQSVRMFVRLYRDSRRAQSR